MARHFAKSLRGKIWLATGALAFFVFTFGVSSYLIITLFVEHSLYVVAFRFILLTLGIIIFGWWLANKIVKPIEKVLLLAKSLERGVSISLPKTSGSIETDDLLQSLHRTNQQMQTVVGLMDKVANGNLDVALTPLQDSDRLSLSFQKLLAKVTESIRAKHDLERLQSAVKQISEEVSQVKNGNLDIEIKSEFEPTKQISDSFKYLLDQLNELVAHVRSDSKQAKTSAGDLQKIIQNIIGAKENRVRELNQAKLALKQIPQSVKLISEELFASAANAHQSMEKARNAAQTAQQNLDVVGELRRQIQEVVKRIGRLNERSQEIGKVSKTLEDLAQRTNMIALNASIQSAESGDKKSGFTMLAEEVERLAARAANTNKQISTLNKTFAAEINEVENSLHESVGEVANLSKFAIETGNSLSELEKYIGRFLHLQEKLAAHAGGQSVDSENALETVTATGETEKAIQSLKESETLIVSFLGSIENLHFAAVDFRIKTIPDTQNLPLKDESDLTFESNFSTQTL